MVRPSLLGLLVACASASAVRAEEPVHFTRDVIPVLTKAGCNSGACHGSFQGRGGLKLSLLGFDPLADFDALVQEARGRRVFAASPEESLLLRKPSGTMAHGGGRKLPVDSAGYRILRDWVRQGTAPPGPGDPSVTRLVVSSPELVLQSSEISQVRVSAVWSDERVQDVTGWALYESTSDAIAEIDGKGRIVARGAGRASMMVRFMGKVANVIVTVPFAVKEVAAAKGNNYIDDFIAAEWRKLGLEPAPLADDTAFLRRVYLDVIGTLPTPAEVRTFLASKDPARRDKVIDQLLERPEFVDYWSLKWGDLLRAHTRALGEKGLKSFSAWLKQSLRENKPADRLVRELLLAQGNLYASGPVAFYFVDKTPEELAETAAQIFLGVRLQCAKCHHHPFEVWSQDDYYGLAAFFARVERKDTKEGGAYGGAQSMRIKATGQVVHPSTGKAMPARVLSPRGASGAQSSLSAVDGDPRQPLADWLAARDNPFFARNIVNRYWGYLFGRGLVEPIDDLRASNPASHPALLEALTKDFTHSGFDVKYLIRTLCRSRAYQLAAEVVPGRDVDNMFYTHRKPRRLPAEVLLDAVNFATGTSDKFTNNPEGTRAIALLDPSVDSYFLETFGRPKRTNTCECERSSNPDLSQVLHLANGEKIHKKVVDPKGRVAALLESNKGDAEIIDVLYLATLSRLPTAEERATVQRFTASAPSRKEAFEDLLWTLVNCGEFGYN